MHNVLKEDLKDDRIKDFIGNKKEFGKLLEKNKEKILETLSETIGEKWEEKDITIYTVPFYCKFPSVPYPLILKIKKDQDFNLQIITHELVHRFLTFNSKLKKYEELHNIRYLGPVKSEALTDAITRHVTTKVFGKKKSKEMTEIEQKIITSRNIEECEEHVVKYQEKYDLNKNSLLHYFKKEKK